MNRKRKPKTVDHYLGLNYRRTVYQDEDGDWIAEAADLPGCMADGATVVEALDNLKEAMRSWLKSRIAARLPVPEPRELNRYSGRILLRMPKRLHRKLVEQAEAENASLNQHIVSLLAEGSAP